MLSNRRQDGAVHIAFLIITIIIALAGWTMWYLANKDFEETTKQMKARTVEVEAKNDAFIRARLAYDDLANEIGLVKELPDPSAIASPEAWKEKVTDNHKPLVDARSERKKFFDAGATEAGKVMDLFLPAEKMVNDLRNEVAKLKRDLEAAVTEKGAAEKANVDVAAAHATQLQEKINEMNQIRERGETQLRASEEKNEQTSKSLKEVSEKLETAVAEHRNQMTKLQDEKIALDREVNLIRSAVRIKRETEVADGKVIEVDARIGMCWIDIGTRNFLRRGTRFKTYGVAKGGVKVDRGYIVVHDMVSDKAECSIEGGANVQAGDFVTNPHFDRDETQNFFFLGNMPGRFDNQTAANILKNFGAKVHEKMSVHVDYIVLGDDPNPENVGENANPEWFKDRSEYSDAIRWGVEMIRARDLETFLMY